MTKINVAIGIIISDKKVCITQRKEHAHLAKYWEFPGGKVEENELVEHTLIRELKEEVNIDPLEYQFYHHLNHAYPECEVSLFFYLISQYKGDLKPNENQLLKWIDIKELLSINFPKANKPVVDQLLNDFL